MSIFDFLRGAREKVTRSLGAAERSSARVSKKQPASPQSNKPEVAKQARTAVKQLRKRPRQKPPKTVEHQMLREWRTEVKKIQEHPLTQAKIINEKLLAAVMELLNEINSKLDELNTRVGQLETVQIRAKEKATPEVRLSSGEQKVIDFVKRRKEVQASDVAAGLKISRPNAALKLNKLFSINLLEKRQDGKDVYYKIP